MPVPPLMPVTTPVALTETVALAVLQVPPGTLDDSPMALPTHTVEEPKIIPAVPVATVTTAVVVAVPQLEDIV
jgi:hypothetical protein